MRILKQNLKIHDLLLLLAGVAFMAVPLAGTFWGGRNSGQANEEHRQLSALPAWPSSFGAWKQFPKAFDAFAHDRFGSRKGLLHGYRELMSVVFHESASPDAFVGKSGWLYLTENDSLADMRGASTYTNAEISNAVEQINARGELLAVRQIRYSFVVFPDKHTIYPQFLRSGVYGGFARRRLSALDAALAQTGQPYYFDATAALRRAASGSPFRLYYKSDTHWNPWGAWLGFKAWQAADGARLGWHPVEFRFGQFRIPHRSAHGDLARMSGYRPEDEDIYPPSGAGCAKLERWDAPKPIVKLAGTIPSHLTTSACGGDGNALVVHDSFMDSIARYVSANYSRTWYVWKYLDDPAFAGSVRDLQPDSVLVERVERLMEDFPPVDLDVLTRQLGVVGESAELDAKGNLQLGNGDNRKTRSAAPVAGALQRIVRAGDTLYIDGWARLGDAPPAAIVAVVDGRVIGEAPVTLQRPRVAVATPAAKLAWSGYRLALPVAALHAAGAKLQLYFVNFDSYGAFKLEPPDRERIRRALALHAALAGARVIVAANKDLVVDGGTPRWPATHDKVAGSLDQIVRHGDQVQLTGWASVGAASPEAIIAAVDGRVVGVAPVARERGDVADAMHNPVLDWSGYALDIPAAMLESRGAQLTLYVIGTAGYGEFSLDTRDRHRIRAALR